MKLPVLTLRTTSDVVGSPTCTSPVSIANGPTPTSMFPQVGLVSTVPHTGSTCANR